MEQAPRRFGRGLVWLSVAWLSGGRVRVRDDGDTGWGCCRAGPVLTRGPSGDSSPLPLPTSVTAAYKHADGKKIDGRRVLVDVERGRTVKGWRPRRLAAAPPAGTVSKSQVRARSGGALQSERQADSLFVCPAPGGGLGGTRRGGADVNIRHSGRDDTSRYDERDRDRDRERERRERSRERDKERERRRSRSRDRRRRSRSRDKEERRRSRERSKDKDRDRKRRSSRSRERARRERERKEELRGGGGDMAEPSEAGDAPPDDGPPGELGPDGPDGPEEKGRDRDRERRRSHRSERERRRDRDRDRDRDREHKRGERGSERGRDEARGGGGGGQDNGLEGLGNDSRDMYMESEGGDSYLAPENGYLMEAAPE
ncbi:U1 small nuclear ribonucleoprotein 70 kDa [Saguinus oedipus]|uniref:U1 small nuclear ribonucleoprotein 70 kDa n=1 Tax=Saguinus oedipus TaxID=9490 RepID=A0ABQ9TWM9_SAGOE|nr:U1 small nuclear ribonucleoprotein 70 kDa [Saguinus oedipus]